MKRNIFPRITALVLAAITLAACTQADVPVSSASTPTTPTGAPAATGAVTTVTTAEVDGSGEVVDSDSETVVETEGITETTANSTQSADTYEYKGITFNGQYYEKRFFVDLKTLSETETGLLMSQEAYSIATAFIANDIEKLMEYFDNDEYADEQIEYMNRWNRNRIDNLIDLPLNNIIISDSDYLGITYAAGFDFSESIVIIFLQMHLNDYGEWKASCITYEDAVTDEKAIEETCSYKGIEFTGRYVENNNTITFIVNKDSIKTGHGMDVYKVSHDIASLFLANDTKGLMEYFDDDKYAAEQMNYMGKHANNHLDNLTYLNINGIGFDAQEVSDGFYVSYIAGIKNQKNINSVIIVINMYLNDCNEWKIKYIHYGDLLE